MSKMSTEIVRQALNGPTMGTRWSALFHVPSGFDPGAVHAALQAAVDEVDAQMSTWKPDSDLMRLNRSPVQRWMRVPGRLLDVIRLGLKVGRASGGAFDIGMGDAVTAWGFGPGEASPDRIRGAMQARRVPAQDALEIDGAGLRKRVPIALDLNGVAKGYGVDRLAEVLGGFGICDGLVGIDGEMRAMGVKPDGEAWTVAVEEPDPERRAPHSILSLRDCSVATSGDYRHWVEVQGRRLSHTMDPIRGAPLIKSPASVTVLAPTCAEADAWATAFMVLGPDKGGELARRLGLDALFLLRGGADSIRSCRIGGLFGGGQMSVPAEAG
ncbi:FAD:protein FMN transferase [Mesorhizobium sp.]|uniref:FAD:protein FMN transferase n=1 Tax=Mesorhizobium sp. TaxID=1871066 RepID=UPI000FE8FCA3|nr:FAD:protein FMN transferase [Mesorhizobium sp.]RWM28127.1 MAG: FAD:protein FMN transferase [Mesorhizobium sp.]RWM41373.1 MAG: FAD:protein FMN transferase [Mesorhizobium sp.]TJV54414.1 MAG: FAD:protein FMN transferase [Mesorhizobium sp.]